ncbi:hypothetical protein B0H11DRAFT_2234317 [Mycena galericulata]|nr:hypothetical protein B0H11DRAFT_2234317 [Mycena galericulata]
MFRHTTGLIGPSACTYPLKPHPAPPPLASFRALPDLAVADTTLPPVVDAVLNSSSRPRPRPRRCPRRCCCRCALAATATPPLVTIPVAVLVPVAARVAVTTTPTSPQHQRDALRCHPPTDATRPNSIRASPPTSIMILASQSRRCLIR